jgi:Uma2 family endonuclease
MVWRKYLKDNSYESSYLKGMETKEPEEGNSEKRYSIEDAEQTSQVNEAQPDYIKRRYTIEEYLEMERASDVKHEYYQGEIFAMSGASRNHIIISMNASSEIHNQLKNKSCRPYGSDMRVYIPENTLFCYPDISIFCDGLTTTDKEDDTAIHPTIIIEILSPSTRSYDLGKKFELYKAIPTFKEYILIDSERIGAKSWRINAYNYWEPEDYKTLEDTVHIPTVGVSLSMKDIYDGSSLIKQSK